jgi:CubicO group peptidase (beta-lactamase class C family)
MTRVTAYPWVAFSALTILAMWKTAAKAEPTLEHLDAIRAVLKEEENRGLCGVLLIRAGNDDLLYKAYGYADREAKRPMTVDTGFCIGSLVKPITAVAILRLEQDGKLSTNDPLSRFFPDVPDDKRDITISQLLRHRAGLDDIFGDDYEVVTRDWFLDKALHSRLIAKPGATEKYSNAGYSLLAVIIEVVSVQSYEAYVNQHVLKPAGTPEIGYVIPQWKTEQLAAGYRGGERWGTPLDHPWAKDGPSWNLRGNGGMLATAKQMCLWYEALFDGKIIDERQLNMYLAFDGGGSRSMGNRQLGHAGGNGVFNTLQESMIDRDVHLTFFTSTSTHSAEGVWPKLGKHFLAIAKEYHK